MPFSSRIISLVLAALSSLAPLSTEAAVTPEQIATAVASPAGATWSASQPESTHWTTNGYGLQLSDPTYNAPHWIQATVTGPGVIGVNLQQWDWSSPNLNVSIDGVAGPNYPLSSGIQRVQLAAGLHTVRWHLARRSTYASSPGTSWLTVREATWQPFTLKPLDTGATGSTVTLGSPGEEPWIGQDAKHHGDGAAAWSGIKTRHRSSFEIAQETPLRASFEGPGLLSFWQKTEGQGHTSFRIDDGTAQNFYSPEWTQIRRLVGPGSHVAEWRAAAWSEPTRGSFEMAVDEIELIPLVPLHQALDTPGREWTALPAEDFARQPFGIADATASGGSMVQGFGNGDPDCVLRTPVSGPAMAKVRYRGNGPTFNVEGFFTSGAILGLPENGWSTVIKQIPAGATEMQVSGTWTTEIDKVEFIPAPDSLATALGLAEGAFTTGGPSPWTPGAYEELGEFGARIEIPSGQDSSWIEMPVQGPAEVRFHWKSLAGPGDLAVLVNGKELGSTSRESYPTSNLVRIEVPAGSHTIRWVARASSISWLSSNISHLAKPVVLPIVADGGVLAALDLNQAVNIPNDWTVSSNLTPDGSPALQAPPPEKIEPDSYSSHRISTRFTGPGELSFRWYAGLAEGQASVPFWSFHRDDHVGEFQRDPSAPAGWKEERVWLPPGDELFHFTVTGTAPQVALSALDQVKFTPSPVVSLGEAADAPELAWTTDANKSWNGIVLDSTGDDVAISPTLGTGESASVEAVAEGPGIVSFRWREFGQGSFFQDFESPGDAAVEIAWEGDRRTYLIPTSGPAVLRWTARASSWSSNDSWLGVDEVSWTPLPLRPLAESLDAPPPVKWETSAEVPFTGRDDMETGEGSYAFVSLKEGQESWLEATVHGPGLFDFWLRGIPGFDLSGNLWEYWSLTIDGEPVIIDGRSWPAQWITGDGPHKIRLTLRNPRGSEYLLAGAVDQVSWTPMNSMPLPRAAGLKKNIWKVSSKHAATGIQGAGRNGGPAVVMRTSRNGTDWVQTTVKGPCEVSWDSTATMNPYRWDSRVWLEVDGKWVADFNDHEWQRMRLTLPAGNHVLRWISDSWGYEGDDEDPRVPFDSVWRISGVQFKKGLSPLAQALDAPGLFALEQGDQGGKLIKIGKNDYWEPAHGSTLGFFSPGQTGKGSFRWGRPDGGCGQFWVGIPGMSDTGLSSTEAGWHDHAFLLRGASYFGLTYYSDPSDETIAGPPLLDAMAFESGPARTLAAALDSKLEFGQENWIGIASRGSRNGKDHAISIVDESGLESLMSTRVQGPAEVSYWWHESGAGRLRLRVNGALLPVPPPSTAWSQVEFRIPEGESLVEWIHSYDGAGNPLFSEAGIDALVVKKAADLSLAGVAAPDSGLSLGSVTETPEQTPWHPVSYREADGTWTDAARAVSGGKKLQVTVQGPALLSFRARAFDGYPSGAGSSISPSSVVIINPGPQPVVHGHLLSVEVDGIARARVAADPSGSWQEVQVHVPEGAHLVEFRLMSEMSAAWYLRRSVMDAIDPDLQGWVDDLNLTSIADHYLGWATAKGLTAEQRGPSADADGDGEVNQVEYALGSDPLDAMSKPPVITIYSPTWNPSSRTLLVPFLPPHVSGSLQSSTDLASWQDYPVALRHFRIHQWIILPDGVPDSDTHQSIPIVAGEPGYYRIQFEDIVLPE